MNRDNGASALCEAALGVARVDGAGHRVDIAQNRDRADVEHTPNGGDESMRRHQHLVARADSCCNHRQVQGSRSGLHRDGVRRIKICCRLPLESLHLRAEAEGARLENAFEVPADFGGNLAPLEGQVVERHDHLWLCRSSYGARGHPCAALACEPDCARRCRTSPMTRAGLPATIAKAETSRVTTAPAAISAPSPISTGRMTAPLPIDARLCTSVDERCQSSRPRTWPLSSVDRGQRSLVNITL